MQDPASELRRIPIPRTMVNKVGILPRFIENSSPPASMDGRSNPTRVARETYKTKKPRSVGESRERKGRNL
jgi:hypothetical protein